ncbi:MAG: hypothetical protein JO053_07500 [Acidobacteria bacterium]|nr:hypothetical protein [Acidobacteriota bacterium]
MKFRLLVFVFVLATAASAQRQDATFTGTAVIYGSGFNTRTTVRNFTLHITGLTPASDADRFLGTLQERGQDALLSSIRDHDLGRFSLSGEVGRPLNAVVVSSVGDKRMIRAVFERWMGFGELRGGYRSTDYPFSYVEIVFDPRTGKGDGTFIPAARVRWNNKHAENEVEIEDFGIYPGRLIGVKLQRGSLP